MEADRFLAGARFLNLAGGQSSSPRFAIGADFLNPLSHNSSMSLQFVIMSDGSRGALVPSHLLADKKFISRLVGQGCVLEEDENTDAVWVREMPRPSRHHAIILLTIDFIIALTGASLVFFLSK